MFNSISFFLFFFLANGYPIYKSFWNISFILLKRPYNTISRTAGLFMFSLLLWGIVSKAAFVLFMMVLWIVHVINRCACRVRCSKAVSLMSYTFVMGTWPKWFTSTPNIETNKRSRVIKKGRIESDQWSVMHRHLRRDTTARNYFCQAFLRQTTSTVYHTPPLKPY